MPSTKEQIVQELPDSVSSPFDNEDLWTCDPNDEDFWRYLHTELNRSHLLRSNFCRSHRTVDHGVTAIIGEMGYGKTLLAAHKLSQKFAQGYEVYSTPEAGFDFGETFDAGDADDMANLMSFGTQDNLRNCYLFVDELSVYLDRFAQGALTSRMFHQSMNALRKNRVHLVFAVQNDQLIGSEIRGRVTDAYFPRVKPWTKNRESGRREIVFRKRKGRIPQLHLEYYWMHGQNVLTWTNPGNSLMQVFEQSFPKPKPRWFYLPYRKAVVASALYDTHARLNIGAGGSVSAAKMKTKSHASEERKKKKGASDDE